MAETTFPATKRRCGVAVRLLTWYPEFRELVLIAAAVYNLERAIEQ